MVSVLIVGAGLSGISQAIQLHRQLGEKVDITIIDREDDIGGTWLNSTWPGAGVDIPIHLYSLYSDPSTEWESFFASRDEVLGYLNDCVDKHGLRSRVRLSTTFISAHWDKCMQGYRVLLEDGQGIRTEVKVNILVSANGPLSAPKLPDLPGLGRFRGTAFHNLEWRKRAGDLEHKRIAVIGNGSSAVQFLPGLAAIEGVQITQYIRSGGYYFPKINYRYSLWQRFAFQWLPGWRRLHRLVLFLGHNDRWKARNDENATGHRDTEQQLIEYLTSTAPKEYVEVLRPQYPLGCKRPAYDQGWLASLHRDNVTLNGAGIREITKDGVVDTDGNKFKADVIISATGANVGESGLGLNKNVFGQNGIELEAFWKSIGGPQSYLGIAVPGFPNYFITVGPNAVAGSWGFTIGNQTTVIAGLVQKMVKYGIGQLQPKRAVFDNHNAHIQEELSKSTMNSDACVSWWRIGGNGRLSVPSHLDAIGLWWETRSINWDHWLAETVIRDASAINVATMVWQGRALRCAVGALTVGVGLAYGSTYR